MRSKLGQQRCNGVTSADDHPIDVAHLTSLCRDPETPGGADQREGSLRTWAGHFEGHGAARLGQRTVGQKGPAPGGNAVAETPAHHLRRETASRPTVGVDQPGLSRQRLAVLDHAYDVVRTPTDARAVHDHQLTGVAKYLTDVRPEATGSCTGIQLCFNHDATADNVQTTGKPERCGNLRLPVAGLGDLNGRQL